MSSIAPGILAACDRVKPNCVITNPGQGSTQSGTINLVASASDNDKVVGVQFYLDGAAYGAEITAAPYQIGVNTAAIASGGHSCYARARDRNGNITISPTVTWTAADQHAPSVSLNSPGGPGSNPTVTGNMLMSAVCSDDYSGVYGVVYYIDGGGVTGWLGAPYQQYYDTHALGVGNHNLTAYCNDNAGNQSSSALTFYVNNQPPAGGQLWFGQYIVDGSGGRTYWQNWDNRFNQNAYWDGTGSMFGRLSLPGNPDPGNYQMQVMCNGNAEGASPGNNYINMEIGSGGPTVEVFRNGFNGNWFNVNGGESMFIYRYSDSPDVALCYDVKINYRFVVRRGS